MCKIVSFTNASKLDATKAAEVIGNILLKIERDGFGYAIQGESNVFGERCIADTFKSRLDSRYTIKIPVVEVRQSTFGRAEKPKGPAIFHGRTSTNDHGLLNCHPMSRDSWNLIHNGVVDDNGPKYDKATTNDSEDLLYRLIQGIDKVESHLHGYYAFTAIDPKGRLHVGRDSIATLFMAWCPKIQSYIIATTERLLEDVASALKIKIGPIDKIKSDTYMIFDGNDMSHVQSIKPLGYDSRQSRHAEDSLGVSLDSKLYQLDGDSRFNRDDGETIDDLLAEIEAMDDTYQIETYDGELISVSAYHKLDEVSKLECTIFRPDGSVVDLEDTDGRGLYWSERLVQGE
jgi:predicted glutamine amidotransferase